MIEKIITILIENLAEIITALGVVFGAILVGGGFLAREKYKLLSEFWYHSSDILHSMKILASPAKNQTIWEAYYKFDQARKNHQDAAADAFFRLQPLLKDEFVKQTTQFFRLINEVNDNYFEQISGQTTAKEQSGSSKEVADYEKALRRAIRKELRKCRYWFLK